ncbi:hypothetical protein AAG570_000168 [Ranatra chinensis]|uniref:G-protein coupled receptor Mth-like 1 n=1 Tax=Ranatra chinensis TaxID=642074 RepID=A0ABD0YWA5_9HEMI
MPAALWLVLCLAAGSAATTASPGDLVVFKCCPADESLTEDGASCRAGGPLTWAPVVYSPTSQSFLEPGTTPDHWKWEASRPTACKQPGYYSNPAGPDGLPPFVLFDNGSLSLLSRDNVFVPPEGYCVDSSGALVCVGGHPAEAASSTAGVRKCCGPGAEYSEARESCVPADKDHPQFAGIDTRSGFPVCLEVGSYAIGGKLNLTHWIRDDGALRDDDGDELLTEFCLERIKEHPDEPLHVFTCTSAPKGHHQNDIRFVLYPVGLFLSVFFLAVTLIASCLLPSTYHVLHWRCQTNHVACLLVGDLLLAITQISRNALQGILCRLIGES